MNKGWGWGITLIFLILSTSNVVADHDIQIAPDILYQDLPVIIQYTGFSDGEEITLDITAASNPDEKSVYGISDGFILHPFTIDRSRLNPSPEISL